jgi:hypothetical protein
VEGQKDYSRKIREGAHYAFAHDEKIVGLIRLAWESLGMWKSVWKSVEEMLGC